MAMPSISTEDAAKSQILTACAGGRVPIFSTVVINIDANTSGHVSILASTALTLVERRVDLEDVHEVLGGHVLADEEGRLRLVPRDRHVLPPG